MATRTQSKSQSTSRNRSQSNRSAFSWGENAGPLIGAAVAGAALGFAAHIGRKAIMQGMEASAGDWFDMLKKDHDEIQKTLEQMLATDESQTWKRSMLLMKLAHKLDKHSYEEENVIYPALRDDNDSVEADQLDTEHGHVKTLIFELKQMDSDSPLWLEKVRKLRDSLDAHIRMEEEQVLPRLKQDLDEEQNARLTMMVNKAGFMMA
ncbi:MAG TPA: hemerythrin domain-containing protein [Sphingomicrobium sp.]|nr:hemerythrin domain-containing protein [Sphingomicrobium sp.]